MNWTRVSEQFPPVGQFLLARGIDDDPVYAVSRHVTFQESGKPDYIRYCTMDGWKLLPEWEYSDSAWCLIEAPKKRSKKNELSSHYRKSGARA